MGHFSHKFYLDRFEEPATLASRQSRVNGLTQTLAENESGPTESLHQMQQRLARDIQDRALEHPSITIRSTWFFESTANSVFA